ncbi:NUDIX domain-containing protein [Candidatus Gracilibacteria bacterium]|nr:NUDIX domain-containing protein [Candidatus Gracilibacteria bacterium]
MAHIKYDEKSCGVVLFREKEGQNHFLVLHYPGGHWDLVKGHVEGDETEQETATRELLEETGIADITYVEGFRQEISYKYYNGHDFKPAKLSNKQVVFFLGKTELEDIHLSHEHKDFIWLPYDEAVEKLTFENAKNLVRKGKAFLG